MPATTPGTAIEPGPCRLRSRPREQVGGGAVAGQRIILDAQAARRAHAVIDHFIAVLVRAVEHHGAAAAEPAHPRLQHAERKRGRDHGIDAVAAGGQHLGADLRRLARLRGDDTALGSHRGFADFLHVGELVAHGFAFDIIDGGVGRRFRQLFLGSILAF
jgi:hypothetical protein